MVRVRLFVDLHFFLDCRYDQVRGERPEDEQHRGLRGSVRPPGLLFDRFLRLFDLSFVHLRLETIDSVRDALHGLLQTKHG